MSAHSFRAAVVVALLVTIAPIAGQTVPPVVRDLARTAAPGWEWDFPTGSSVTYRQRFVTGPNAGHTEVHTRRVSGRTAAGINLEIVLDGSGEVTPWLPQRLAAEELEAWRATFMGEDRLIINGRAFDTVIYQFVELLDERASYLRLRNHAFWLSADAPAGTGGVLRHITLTEERTTERAGRPSSTDRIISSAREDSRVTDLNVQLDVAGRKVSAFCLETETGDRTAEWIRSRICKSPDVPGHVVRAEARKFRGTQELIYTIQEVVAYQKK